MSAMTSTSNRHSGWTHGGHRVVLTVVGWASAFPAIRAGLAAFARWNSARCALPSPPCRRRSFLPSSAGAAEARRTVAPRLWRRYLRRLYTVMLNFRAN